MRKKQPNQKKKLKKVEKVENGKEEIDEKNTKESERPSTHQQQTSNLLTKKNIFEKTPTMVPQFFCSNCSSNCSKLRYRNKIDDFSICPKCFTEGRYPEKYSSNEFLKIESLRDNLSSSEWTDEETLLLLEALEKNLTWDEVSEHVITKTKDECIHHFLRLPIEDNYLEEEITQVHLSDDRKQESEKSIPFETTSNPILNMVQFLSNSVDKSIGVVAAQAAIKEFEKKKGSNENNNKITREDIKNISIAVVGVSSVHAKILAEKQDQEIKNLVAEIIQLQLEKIDQKIKMFHELETKLTEEYILMESLKNEVLEGQKNIKNKLKKLSLKRKLKMKRELKTKRN